MREEIRKLYEAGVSIKGIAERVGITESNVGNYLVQLRKDGKVGRRMKNNITPEEKAKRDKKILSLYRSGKTPKEICDIINKNNERKTHSTTVYKILRDADKMGKIELRKKEVCTFTPGKACLECPFEDCVRGAIKNAGDISSEEVSMVRDSGAFKKKITIILDDEYSHKRRYINGFRDY